ncbi:MAG: S-layer homology domain-containing protein [Acidobacteriota bacterium]
MARLGRPIALAAVACMLALAPIARGAEVVVTVTSTPEPLFIPKYVTIQVGDTVTWKNVDGTHNVVSDDGTILSGFVAPAPWTFSWKFTSAGTVPYYCAIHGNIGGVGQAGVVFVRPAHPASEITYEKSAWDFHAVVPGTATASGPEDLMRSIAGAGGGNELLAGMQLPAGSKIAGLEVTGCDESDTADLTASLLECPDPTGPCTKVASVSSTGAPGCDFFATSVDGPNLNNIGNTYALSVQLGSDTKVRFRNVRVYYKRVPSPPPLVATFADVPTNYIFFRGIEALAASGITSGCGNGNFCPNDPVTRGTMASFLARALGLFWPN